MASKCVWGRGSALDPAGELTALPRPNSCIRGGKGKGEEGKRRKEGREGKNPELKVWLYGLAQK